MTERLLRVSPALLVLLALPGQALASSVTYQMFDFELPCEECVAEPVQDEDAVAQFLSVSGLITTDGTIGPLAIFNLIGLDILVVQFGEDNPGVGSLLSETSWSKASGDPSPFALPGDTRMRSG